jgi:trans-aconitate 2-methyltransferase
MNSKTEDAKQQSDWSPDAYLKFRNERTQPSIDLISKINIGFSPKSILDVWCGPGNSSQALLQRWSGAKLTGIDSSANMIAKAKTAFPANTWIVADAAEYKTDSTYDIVFSNATIQWIPNHEMLFKRLFELTNPGGVLAISVPRFDEMPLAKAIERVSNKLQWKEATKSCSKLFTYRDYQYYYNLMSAGYNSVEFWQTDYIHVLSSQPAIIEWIRSTGMKPYLDCLPEKDRPQFEIEVLTEIRQDYPAQNNGKVLFPFKRLFMTGIK